MKRIVKETSFFTMYSIGEGIYAAIAKPGQGAWSNAGVVDLGDSLLIFDSFGTPTAGKELRRQAEDLTGKPVKYLVNSHYHGDHVFGNQAFKDVPIIATSTTLKLCAERHTIGDVESEVKEMEQYLHAIQDKMTAANDQVIKQSLKNQYEEIAKLLEDLPRLETVLPSLIFEDKKIIRGNEREVELICLGGGHTSSDTFMYIPDGKIAFMGDLLTEKLHLPIFDLAQFQGILRSVSDHSLSEALLDYLSFLTGEAKKAHERAEGVEDFLSRIETPDEYADWKGVNGIKANLITAYHFYEK